MVCIFPPQTCRILNDFQAIQKVLFENTFTQIGLDWSFEVITGGWGQSDMQSDMLDRIGLDRIGCGKVKHAKLELEPHTLE